LDEHVEEDVGERAYRRRMDRLFPFSNEDKLGSD